jgi:hypothetical protein
MIPEVTLPSRRSVVAVAAVGAVAGCSGDGSGAGSRAGSAKAVPEPGAAERVRAVRDSTALLISYDAALAAHPALAARLTPLRAEVARHILAFGGRIPADRAPVPSSSPTPTAALAALADAERTLAGRRTAALLTVPGDMARLLASVAAAGAGHVVLLGPGAENE